MTLRRIAARESDRDPASRAMLAEYAEVLKGDGGRWVRELTGADLARFERGGLHAVLWLRNGVDPAGLALWDLLPGVGRRVWVYLAPLHRSLEALEELLEELDSRSEHEGPVASVLDFIPGLAPELQEPTFAARGFFPAERLVLRLPAEAPFPDESLFGRPDLRPLDASDRSALVDLMRSAYDPLAGQPVPWLAYRDPRQDAADAIEELLEGRRGEWLPWASFGLDVGGRLQAASLVSHGEVPVINEVMVHPSMRQIGLGFRIALESVRVLRERGLLEPRAVVAGRDMRGLRLLRRLGFEVSPERAVGLWVNRVAVGALSVAGD